MSAMSGIGVSAASFTNASGTQSAWRRSRALQRSSKAAAEAQPAGFPRAADKNLSHNAQYTAHAFGLLPSFLRKFGVKEAICGV